MTLCQKAKDYIVQRVFWNEFTMNFNYKIEGKKQVKLRQMQGELKQGV